MISVKLNVVDVNDQIVSTASRVFESRDELYDWMYVQNQHPWLDVQVIEIVDVTEEVK